MSSFEPTVEVTALKSQSAKTISARESGLRNICLTQVMYNGSCIKAGVFPYQIRRLPPRLIADRHRRQGQVQKFEHQGHGIGDSHRQSAGGRMATWLPPGSIASHDRDLLPWETAQ